MNLVELFYVSWWDTVSVHLSPGCPWMWDNLTCWQPAKIGEVVEVNCPELFSQFMSEEDFGEFKVSCFDPETMNESCDAVMTGCVSTEVGTVSRNCSEFGWSETIPHYIDACLYDEGNSSHPVSAPLSPHVGFRVIETVIKMTRLHPPPPCTNTCESTE